MLPRARGCEAKFFERNFPHGSRTNLYTAAYFALTVHFINTPLQRGVGAAGATKTVLTVLSSRHLREGEWTETEHIQAVTQAKATPETVKTVSPFAATDHPAEAVC